MQAKREKAGYGLVLALQVSVPHACLTCVQSLSAEFPDHPRQMFRLEVSDIQTAVALEDTEQDIRWGFWSSSNHSIVLLYNKPQSPLIKCLHANCMAGVS